MVDPAATRVGGPARPRQRGVALITVLLVVALATAAAAAMTRQHVYDVRRTGNQLALIQARAIALGGEDWARALLRRDRRGLDDAGSGDAGFGDAGSGDAGFGDDGFGSAGNDDAVQPDRRIDSRDEDWARPLPSIPVEGGQITGRISDAQGRFNVNSLIDKGHINALALARFQRLLQALKIDPAVTQAVIDWLDEDHQASYPGGAEDDYYSTRDPPYRAANRPLVAASELRLVRGIDAAAWQRLRPHVTALPGDTAINVNTADPVMLQAIVPKLGIDAARQLFALAGDKPFADVAAFRRNPLVKGKQVDPEGLAVSSRYFRVRADVHLGPIQYTRYSWLLRDDRGATRVLRRARTPD